LGSWEAGRLGGWEAGKIGGWEAGKLGSWEVGKLGGWEAGRILNSKVGSRNEKNLEEGKYLKWEVGMRKGEIKDCKNEYRIFRRTSIEG
jgi:hypothetical protein